MSNEGRKALPLTKDCSEKEIEMKKRKLGKENCRKAAVAAISIMAAAGLVIPGALGMSGTTSAKGIPYGVADTGE